MIVFQQYGRLGNQLFQYVGLRTLCSCNEKLVLFGFETLQSAFDGLDAKIINTQSPRLERYLSYRLYKAANYLSQRNIISRLRQSKTSLEFYCSSGFIKNITFAEKNYFQSESLFDPNIASSLTLKPEILASAKHLLNKVSCGRVPIYVHIRRGDYLHWPKKQSPAALPDSYYHKCIALIKSSIPNAFFFFASDDLSYVKDVFGSLDNSYICSGTHLEDFALMTQCQGGILSASSFAWWAAYFANTCQDQAIFLAPKYWIGHRQKQWYPAFIESAFLTYVEVD